MALATTKRCAMFESCCERVYLIYHGFAAETIGIAGEPFLASANQPLSALPSIRYALLTAVKVTIAKGISVHGDVLVNVTADGVDLNEAWSEGQEVLELWNKERKSITDLLSFKTVNVADAVPQSITTDSLEESTELGLPPSCAASLGRVETRI